MQVRAGFEFPKFELPDLSSVFGGAEAAPTAGGKGLVGGIAKSDRVAVIGASGNVGRLACLRLADLGVCKVRAVCRDGNRVRGFFADTLEADGSEDEVEVVEADVKDEASLRVALEDCQALVVVTGTTAFPTLAWRGGNTPAAIDDQGVKNILSAWKACGGGAKKKVVLMSSIGVERRTDFPFVILNAAGVLDAKAAGEAALKAAASGGGPDQWIGAYSIVRPGQLIGGPYENNYYLGTLARLDRPARSVLLWDDVAKGAVSLGAGDELLGDTYRSTAAECVVKALLTPLAVTDFAVVNVDGESPSDAELQGQLESLV